jgi:hypothetical protein
MSQQCITCDHFTLRGHPLITNEKSRRSAREMAKHGFGQCKQGPLFKFFSFDRPHECRVHKPAQTEVIEQRSAWLHKPRGQASEA